jgi:hypothetical protein
MKTDAELEKARKQIANLERRLEASQREVEAAKLQRDIAVKLLVTPTKPRAREGRKQGTGVKARPRSSFPITPLRPPRPQGSGDKRDE